MIGGSFSRQGSLGTRSRPRIGSRPDMDKAGRPCVATWKRCCVMEPILLCHDRLLMRACRDRKFRVATGLDVGAVECVATARDTARSAQAKERSVHALYTRQTCDCALFESLFMDTVH